MITKLDLNLGTATNSTMTFNKTSYLNEEVNRTSPSPSISVPWSETETEFQNPSLW
jgi:hypothetical protein